MIVVFLRSNKTLGQLHHHPLPFEWMLCGPGAQGYMLPCSSLAGPSLPVWKARLSWRSGCWALRVRSPFLGTLLASFSFLYTHTLSEDSRVSMLGFYSDDSKREKEKEKRKQKPTTRLTNWSSSVEPGA